MSKSQAGAKSGGKVKLNKGKLNKKKRRYEQFKFDMLQMYMNYPYVLECGEGYGRIEISSPCIGTLIELGQDRFFAATHPFVTNTTQYRLPLWEAGKDWNEMSDFELFITFICARNMDNEALSLIFGDNIDWNSFYPYSTQEDGAEKYYLISEESNIKIDEDIYQHITQYMHYLLNVFPDEDVTSQPAMKRKYIERDRKRKLNAEIREKQGEEKNGASLQPLISACVNHPGFKYKISELKELTVVQFYDSVHRLQIYESTTALLKGMYSGFCDTSKIPDDSFNWMRAIN